MWGLLLCLTVWLSTVDNLTRWCVCVCACVCAGMCGISRTCYFDVCSCTFVCMCVCVCVCEHLQNRCFVSAVGAPYLTQLRTTPHLRISVLTSRVAGFTSRRSASRPTLRLRGSGCTRFAATRSSPTRTSTSPARKSSSDSTLPPRPAGTASLLRRGQAARRNACKPGLMHVTSLSPLLAISASSPAAESLTKKQTDLLTA